MNNRSKWKCSVCTYENWPASVKCSLCRELQPPLLIEQEMERLQASSKDLESNHPSTAREPEQPVQCFSCTYVNKYTAFKCEQCFNVLRGTATNPPLSTQALLEPKWSCPQCTYENWPKSRHCIMCHGPPPVTSLLAKEEEDESGNTPVKVSTSTSLAPSSNRRSRVNVSSLPVKIRDKLWIGACMAILDGEVTPIERYILAGGRMDRKLTKQECRCLDQLAHSVEGGTDKNNRAANNDSPSLPLGFSSDINSTSKSSLCLDENSTSGVGTWLKCRTGFTLVDMAIRYGRTDLINLFIALSGLQATSAAVSLGNASKFSLRNIVLSHESGGSNKIRRSVIPQSNPTNHLPLHQIITKAPSLMSRSGVNRSKWMPCEASPHVAKELRDTIAFSIRYRRGEFQCAFLSELGTFALPHSVTKLPPPVKYLLLSELCDTEVQSELEDDAKIINWWFIPGQKQASRLFALWNRTAGDCLLDSVLQACWGIFDRENCLRRTLAESLRSCEMSFYPRWRDYEALQAACHYILDETQCRRDWDNVIASAEQPGGALEQIHIFVLSHILRRPIIVYGIKYIKNFRDEPIGIANFQGIYLPLLCERNACCPNPIVLGYTRGHFTALVPMELSSTGSHSTIDSQLSPNTNSSPTASRPSSSSSHKDSHAFNDELSGNSLGSMAPSTTNIPENQLTSMVSESVLSTCAHAGTSPNTFIYLPLVDRQGNLLPIHFTTEKEAVLSQSLLRDWLDVITTRRGIPLSRLRLQPRHLLVDRMLDDWLETYRALAKLSTATPTGLATSTTANATDSTNSSAHSASVSSNSSLADSDAEDQLDPLKLDQQR